jgi:integrase/recombinase XerD
MSESYYERPWCLQRQRRGPLDQDLDGWIGQVTQRGYAQSTGQEYIREFGRLNRWLAAHGIDRGAINAAHLEAYSRGRRKKRQHIRGALIQRLQRYLQDAGIDALPSAQPIELVWLASYRAHLVKQRGLAPDTIRRHLRVTRSFMATLSDNPPDWKAITPDAVATYLITRSKQRCSVGDEAAVLRNFLRFAVQQGHVDARVVVSVPKVRHWRLSGVPECLNEEQLARLAAEDTGSSTKARRDRAIVLLLSRLGLRAIEVCRLTLDDIDWDGGSLCIHGKFGKLSRLPLTQEVGTALALYVRESRPNSTDRHVFLTLAAPRRGFMQSSIVSKIARQALARIGEKRRQGAAHLLRHSCATAMLRQGATLGDIAQILRHADTATTAIYAKLDRQRLQLLARVWPEGGVQ